MPAPSPAAAHDETDACRQAHEVVGLGRRGRRLPPRGQAGASRRSCRRPSTSTSTRPPAPPMALERPADPRADDHRTNCSAQLREAVGAENVRPRRPRPHRAHLRQERARPAPAARRRHPPGARRGGLPGRRGRGAAGRRPVVVAADAVLIPFGGGSNISGSLQAPAEETRPVISVDLGRLNQVLDIDEESGLARIQAGALGPDIEEQLSARGWTLGHFPDSFTHSTLGGWVATRSSGMQSDKYGDIADITRGLRVVLPGKVLVDPAAAQHLHRAERPRDDPGHRGPARRHHRGHRAGAPDPRGAADPRLPLPAPGRTGLAAMQEISTSDARPSVTRVSDARETGFSFATRKKSAGSRSRSLVSKGLMKVLERRGWDLEPDLPVVHRLRGRQVPRRAARRRSSRRSSGQHGGIVRRQGPGRALRPEEVRHPVHPRLPARPGRGGGRVGDLRAVVASCKPLYDNVIAATRTRSYARARRDGLHHVPPVALLPLAAPASTSPSRSGTTGSTRWPSTTGVKSRHPADVRRLRRDAVAPPRGRHRARAVAGAGHLRARRGDDRGAVRRDGPGPQPQPRQDHRWVVARGLFRPAVAVMLLLASALVVGCGGPQPRDAEPPVPGGSATPVVSTAPPTGSLPTIPGVTPSAPSSTAALRFSQTDLTGRSGSLTWRVRIPVFAGSDAVEEINQRIRASAQDAITAAATRRRTTTASTAP